MKDVKTIKKVSLTFDELIKCENVPSNRCGYLTKEDAFKNGFSEADWIKFESRAKKLKKTIETKGFSKASFFVLAKDFNDIIYILDGQGRRKALSMISEKNDMSNMAFICDMYVNPMTLSEMSALIKDMNTGNTNWQSKDIRRSDALFSNDEDVIAAWCYTKEMQEKYGLCDYIVNLLTYGERASHQRKDGIIFSRKDYASTKDVFTEAYLTVIDQLSSTKDKNGNDIKHPSKVIKKIKGTNFAISFVSCLRRIIKGHNNNIEESKSDIDYFVEKLIAAGKGDKDYVYQFVKCDGKDKFVVWEKVRKHCRRRSIVDTFCQAYNN